MNACVGTIDPDDGAIVDVELRAGSFTIRHGAATGGEHRRVRAVFDTGSEVTLVQAGLPGELGAQRHDIVTVVGVHDVELQCNAFDVDLAFPETDISICNLFVAEASFRHYTESDIQVIIGRSVLRRGTFHYDGWKGLFSFELPSPGES